MTQEHTGEFTVALSMDTGEITLDAAEIKQLYFIEDIFSFTMVGKIIIFDGRGIFEFGPLTGNEVIKVVYGEEEEKHLSFKIYKVSKIDQVSSSTGNIEIIELFFAEESFFMMNFFQYSRSWKEEKISDIVKFIGKHYLNIEKWGEFEDTNEELEFFYIPFWNVNTTLLWLMKRATGSEGGEPGYLFYNNTHGANFITLESLLMNEDMMPPSNGEYIFQDPNIVYYNKILEWSISGVDMTSLKHLSGGVKKGYYSKTKQFIHKEFEYSESVDRQTILGKKTLFPDISDKRVSYQTIGESDIGQIDTIFHNNWNKKYAHQQCISITVRGHEDRYCGGMIEIFWPSGDIEEHYNKHLHGKYLVKSITHIFDGHTRPTYRQKMVLIKNGYGDSDITALHSSAKTNN